MFANNNTVSPPYSVDGGSTFSNFNEFQNLEYGTYNVFVKDGNGCITDSTIEVLSAAQK